MTSSPFEMRFDPKTIKHLGVRMYSTLPPAIAEIVANSFDADAGNVLIDLREVKGKPMSIRIVDDGDGLTQEEVNSKFLVIGRNRRADEGDDLSPRFGRRRIGKKGLGKLALFGLADTITISTIRDGRLNEFVLDWNDLTAAQGVYRPKAVKVNEATSERNGTTVSLTGLKRKSPFDANGLAAALSRLFVTDDTFKVAVRAPSGEVNDVDPGMRYLALNVEFTWDVEDPDLLPPDSPFAGKLSGQLMTAATPISPASGLRGISLFSRGKLVNAPEYFSVSASSHFYQYLTGWISVDFVDEIPEDVISTNRQSLDWEHPEMAELRGELARIVAQVGTDWRKRRKEKKRSDIKEATGIDAEEWLGTMPPDVRAPTSQILEGLGGEESLDKLTPIIKALHKLVPAYPLLHWRHLHPKVRDRVRHYYENRQYGDAASQGVQIFCELVRQLVGSTEDGARLVSKVFGNKPFSPPPPLQLNDLSTESEQNIQEGQGHLSRGVVIGFRNPISHAPMDTAVPAIFSELDCLNILSLVSYLVTRLDNARHNPQP